MTPDLHLTYSNQRTNGPVNAHLISGPIRFLNVIILNVIIYINFVELESPMLHAKFQDYRMSGSGEEDFKGFYHIWAWWPSWSCDLYHLYKLSFLLPKEAPYEIWH